VTWRIEPTPSPAATSAAVTFFDAIATLSAGERLAAVSYVLGSLIETAKQDEEQLIYAQQAIWPSNADARDGHP
jgi:hypothetical protein